MRRITGAAVAALAIVAAGWVASEATARTAGDAGTAPVQRSQPLQRLAQASFSGTFEGNVDRRFVKSGERVATRLYRIAMNPDLINGTVWIYEGGALLHILLISGSMQSPGVFIGTTRPVEGKKGYKPDNIRLVFSSDGQSVGWHHGDGNLEGSGTLVRR